MNRLIYFALIYLMVMITSCSKTEQLLYNDISRVQMVDTATINTTFVYEPSTVTRDTVYIPVNTIGKTADHDREVKVIQVAEANEPNPAVPGVHYVAMDDPSLKSLMVVKANTVRAMIPVVLLRDASLKSNSFRLRLQLVDNDQFGLGELQRRTCAIRFSDRLERFFSWRVDGGTAPAFITFGKYSTRKHQFMIDSFHEQIDETWYKAVLALNATEHYKNLIKEILATYNNDPVNIASGESPMRETDDPNSPVITFP